MDHNLDDSLNLESSIGVDFEHSEDTVVNQADISLGGEVHDDSIPMEFEHIEEQPILMDTGNEEVIGSVPDFMGEQFILQEYPSQDDQMATIIHTGSQQHDLAAQSEPIMDLQFEPQTIQVPAMADVTKTDVPIQPKIITLKASAPSLRPIVSKKDAVLTPNQMPRQVAIAPKLANIEAAKKHILLQSGKPFQIAPKPAFSNKTVSLVKKVAPAGGQATSKGNTVLAQIGKQLVMVPAGAQKIKLVTSGSGVSTVRVLGTTDNEQAQVIIGSTTQGGKPVKVILQGQQLTEGVSPQLPVISKVTSGAPAPRLVTVQKTVPISIANNTLMMSPTTPAVKLAKKLITIKPQLTNRPILPAPTSQGSNTKKLVISSNPTQNVVLKSAQSGVVTKVSQISKTPKTQLHQINVPGKGIQYIRLVTNTSSAKYTTTPIKAATATSKSFVLTDGKGNMIQMNSEKPPPLVVTSSGVQRVTSKPQQKLVRIAPVSKAVVQQRGQSLLAPISPAPAPPEPVSLQDVTEILAQRGIMPEPPPQEPVPVQAPAQFEMPCLDDSVTENHDDVQTEEDKSREERYGGETDSKEALRALIADTVGEDAQSQNGDSANNESQDGNIMQDNARLQEHIDYGRIQSMNEDSNSADAEHPLIVIPSYMKQEQPFHSDHTSYVTDDSKRMINVDLQPYDPFQTADSSQALSDSDLGLRPRKACNCTKSQCLKLYCDCFANGEFCNRCNCINCHNNLENEELRQKAIWGCLDRNPNAFRPKIGKSKTGGPEIIRRHNKGCNCKRSGCLKNYCECYEAKIACTSICKCVGCRNVEETLERARRHRQPTRHDARRPQPIREAPLNKDTLKQPCSFMTSEVIEAVCQCLLAAAVDNGDNSTASETRDLEGDRDPVRDVIEEFARCLQDIISASLQAQPMNLLDETHA